ncbi:MAG TPA: PAS domain S-box protein, partial [Dongiaceae bacterium]|nr:PAS domain S-box protein [Dongiaceae bacterium]
MTDLEADCRQVLRTHSLVEREVSPGDRRAHYVMRIVPYRTVDNVVDGVVITFFDITERKLREEERSLTAAIVDSSNDAILTVSRAGLITSWNAAAERLYGYTAQEIVGRPVTMLVPPDRLSEVALIDERVMAGERVDHLETVRLGKNGRLIDVSLGVSPIRDASGDITSISIIVRDLSDRKRAELQRIMLAELNHRVKNSFAIVSALARRTLRTSPSPSAFVAAFEGRLKAFGRTHNALSQERWVG